jgi:hypothetical protein
MFKRAVGKPACTLAKGKETPQDPPTPIQLLDAAVNDRPATIELVPDPPAATKPQTSQSPAVRDIDPRLSKAPALTPVGPPFALKNSPTTPAAALPPRTVPLIVAVSAVALTMAELFTEIFVTPPEGEFKVVVELNARE